MLEEILKIHRLKIYPDANLIKDNPNEELDMTKFEREFGLKTIENVELKIVRSGADDFLITSKHVVGDRLYSVAKDGQIEYEELRHSS